MLFSTALLVFAQNKKLKENVIYGDYYFNQQKYREALDLYLMAFQEDSSNFYLNYQIGVCYWNIPEQWQKSQPFFQTASENISGKQSDVSYSKGHAPPNAFFLLGEVYQRSNSLDSALQAFLDYKDLLSPSDKTGYEKVNFKIQSIAIAKGLIADPLHVIETNLGPTINTRFSDYNPVVSEDEKTLIYTSFWESADLIFLSHNQDGAWSNPVDITQQLGSDGSFYTSALSPDGRDLYLIEEDDFNSDIYVSHQNDSGFTLMQKLNNKINSLSHETSVSVSADGNFLYFSSNRPGGYGGFDIYRSQKKDGDWDKPGNLGDVINTPFNEEAPAITADGKNLFFCSEGHRNMGGMDIFYSSKMDDETWSKPQNIGYPVNTTADNLFYFPIKNGEVAYLSKNDAEGVGRNDIYRVEFPINEILQQAISEDNEREKVNQEIVRIKDQPQDTNYAYVVQIMALRKEIEAKYFKEFDRVDVYKGNDNLYRYIIGKFREFKDAENLLEKVHNFGYKDAFIRTLSSVTAIESEN